MERILVVIDMQKDFITGALGSSAAQAVVDPIAELLREYRERGGRVIYTADTHPPDEYRERISRESICIPRHCVRGEEGWEILDELRPAPGERVVEKPSFGSLTLADAIGKLDPDTVIELCGVCTDICIASNALSLRASYPNNKITVRQACCAGTSREAHRAALTVMRSCLIDVQ